MECPDDQTLSGFIDGVLAAPAVGALESHIDLCPECRSAMTHVLRARRADDIATNDAAGEPDDWTDGVGARVGRYRLLDALGAGGMGVVYVALDTELDRLVALKVLRDDGDASDEGDERLRAEAQTLACISHPNVLAVYDVGRVGRRRFLAMELVDGATLRGHLAQRKPAADWRERVRLLVGAGRGLAAAHALGIVHRDVKPENVLVGTDGRPRVADFGLARAAPASLPDGAPAVAASTAAGTPAYLAPELRDGAGATAASDQFAFATMCWELLHDARPASEPRLPRGRRGQRRVADALRRGLAVDPAARWPSVVALVDALEAAARPPSRRVALVAVSAIGGAIVLGLAILPSRGDEAVAAACAGISTRVTGLWSDVRAAAVRDAFGRAGSSLAPHATAAVDVGLRQRIDDWSAAATTACRRDPIGFAAGAGPVECLERRHAETAALVEIFASADRMVVRHAAGAVAGLADAAACLETLGPAEPPRPATWLARVRQLAVMRTELTFGRSDAAYAAAEALANDLEVADAPALRAEAMRIMGQVERLRGHLDAAHRLLIEASSMADRAGADQLRAETLLDLSWLAAADQVRLAEADDSLQLARGVIARLGDPPALLANAEQGEAKIAALRGESDAAIELLLHAISMSRGAYSSPLVEPGLRTDLGGIYLRVGRLDEALAEFERVAVALEAILGPDHLDVGGAHTNIAAALHLLRRLDEAEVHAQRAVDVMRAAMGDSRRLAQGLGNLGIIQGEHGRRDAGIATTEEALHMFERQLGPVHADVANTLLRLGKAHLDGGELDAAAASYRRAIDTWTALDNEPRALADALIDLAAVELTADHPAVALAAAERASRVYDAHPGLAGRERTDEAVVECRAALARRR